MRIKDWPVSDRPRERLLAGGPERLSDAELLALFLGTGTKGQSAVDLARSWIAQKNGLRNLLSIDFAESKKLLGMGPARFAVLQATMELSRRIVAQDLCRDATLDSSRAVTDWLKLRLKTETVEVFYLLSLDSQCRVVGTDALARGSVGHVHVELRQLIEVALSRQAHSVILAHNHPSGTRVASQADIEFTRRAKQALALLGIRLLDHLIVADGEPLSMAAEGLC